MFRARISNILFNYWFFIIKVQLKTLGKKKKIGYIAISYPKHSISLSMAKIRAELINRVINRVDNE